MEQKRSILVAGGDLRQRYAAENLRRLPGWTVEAQGLLPEEPQPDQQMPYDVLVLPMPACPDGKTVPAPFGDGALSLEMLLRHGKQVALVLGGGCGASVQKAAEAAGQTAADYMQREELCLRNAIPTAEGAIQIAMEELATTIYGQNVLVTGFGRISKVLVRILTAMGAHVTVTARKYQDLAWAEISGCRAVHISRLEETLPGYDLVFNTVPAVLLDEARLWKLRSDALIIDLASKPGGVDNDTASRLGLKTVWALSLPGKVAPITAGDMIACTIRNILKERSFADD